MAGESVFIDTSVRVAAAVELHPDHSTALTYVEGLVRSDTTLFLSPQIRRELLVTLTRQPVNGRSFSVEEALDILNQVGSVSTVLDEVEAVSRELDRHVERHDVRGKQVHDCNIVATMRVHGVRKLATRSADDFKRYERESEVVAVD